jgi:hypothetical protein
MVLFALCYSIYLSSLEWGKDSLVSNAVPLIFGVIAALVFINQIKSKVIISDTSIFSVNLFLKKELELKNIRGFRIYGKQIFIEPIEQGCPRLEVYNYTDGNQFLWQWCEKNLTDLDKK